MEEYNISEACKIRYKKFIEPNLTPEQVESIKGLAKDIQKRLGIGK